MSGNPHGGSAAKKGRRAAVFAQWLVDTYGWGLLSCGTGGLQCTLPDEVCIAFIPIGNKKLLPSYTSADMSPAAGLLKKSGQAVGCRTSLAGRCWLLS